VTVTFVEQDGKTTLTVSSLISRPDRDGHLNRAWKRATEVLTGWPSTSGPWSSVAPEPAFRT